MQGDEPLAGTAMSAQQYVFISWSKKLWARKQYDSHGFPQSLSIYLQNLQKEKRIFTRLIHQRNRELKDHSHIFIMPDGIAYEDVPIPEIENILQRYFEGKSDEKYQRTSTKGAYIFCCTHGKRDRCCAKFGQFVIYELKRIAEEKAFDLNVWECTHIGADRLAATAMVFPHGYMYGGMRVENISEIVEHLIKGYPYPPCFRGQLGLGSTEQTTQAFGHFYWFENKIENADVIVESVQQHSPDECKAYVIIKDKDSNDIHAKFALTLQKKDFLTYMDCDGVKENIIRRVSRWVISEASLVHSIIML
jgi:hypothetical protein